MPKPERKRHVLRDPAELEAVVSPVRHHLLRALANLGPCAIKDLAADLGRTPESLYYHVRALEEVGLVVGAGSRSVNGHTERLYRSVARELVTDKGQSTAEYLEAYRRSTSALLRLADRQVGAAVERQQESGERRSVSLRVQQYQARLSPAAQREVARRIEELLAFLRESDDPDQVQRVALTVVSAPL